MAMAMAMATRCWMMVWVVGGRTWSRWRGGGFGTRRLVLLHLVCRAHDESAWAIRKGREYILEQMGDDAPMMMSEVQNPPRAEVVDAHQREAGEARRPTGPLSLRPRRDHEYDDRKRSYVPSALEAG
jgi:hypothetical protein